jgi:hypothetical protein
MLYKFIVKSKNKKKFTIKFYKYSSKSCRVVLEIVKLVRCYIKKLLATTFL